MIKSEELSFNTPTVFAEMEDYAAFLQYSFFGDQTTTQSSKEAKMKLCYASGNHMEDVEELNLLASKNLLDITKVSYHAFCFCIQNYILLDSGSALGTKCGPLLIKKKSLHLKF